MRRRATLLLLCAAARATWCPDSKSSFLDGDKCATCKAALREHRIVLRRRRMGETAAGKRAAATIEAAFRSPSGVAYMSQDLWFGESPSDLLLEGGQRQASLLRWNHPVCPFNNGGANLVSGWFFTPGFLPDTPGMWGDCGCNAHQLHSEASRRGHFRDTELPGETPCHKKERCDRWCDEPGVVEEVVAKCGMRPDGTFRTPHQEKRWLSHRCASRNWHAVLDDGKRLREVACAAVLADAHPGRRECAHLGLPPQPAGGRTPRELGCLDHAIKLLRQNQIGLAANASTLRHAVAAVAYPDYADGKRNADVYSTALRAAAALRAAPERAGAPPVVFAFNTTACDYGRSHRIGTALPAPPLLRIPARFPGPSCDVCCAGGGEK